MKYFSQLLVFIALFLVFPNNTNATSYTFPTTPQNYKIELTCLPLSCEASFHWLTVNKPNAYNFSIYTQKNSSGFVTGTPIFKKIISFPNFDSTSIEKNIITFTIPSLTAGKTYYANYSGSTYTFQTEKDTGYKLSLVQQNGVLNVAYYTPVGDTRAFFLNYKDSTGRSVLTQAAPADIQKVSSSTTTIYSYTVGDITKSIAAGSYRVTLEAIGTTGAPTVLYGPVPVSFTKTALVSGTVDQTGVFAQNTDYQWPLDYSKATETPVVLKGKINTTENADFKTFEITVELNINSDFSGESKLGTVAISDDGTYTATFSDLTPSTTYNVRHSIKTPQSATDEKIDKFNSTRGHFTAGSSGEQADFNSRSYKLLSPLPNLAVLFDPDLCVEQLAAGKPVFGGSCDNQVNEFINYLFQLLIGLTAVILVIKIMYNGYQYIMTDVPFLKAGMKNSLWQSVFGLLVVLSSFLILNTINPKLVENVVSLQPVLVEVKVWDRAGSPDFIANLDSFSTQNIKIDPSNYNDPDFLGYLTHQQGVAGASAILWAANKGYSSVPKNNPFTNSDINRNMRTNFNLTSAQKTIGTTNLTPSNFLQYWAIKVAATRRTTTPQIPPMIDTQLVKVSSETGVNITELRTMCRIESLKGCTDPVLSVTHTNEYGYAGLFQLSKEVFTSFGKKGGQILDAYHNAYAAANYYKSNLTSIQKKWPTITK